MKNAIILLVGIFICFSCASDDDEGNASVSFPDTGQPSSIIVNPAFDVDQMIGAWTYDTLLIDGVESSYEHNVLCERDLFAFYNSEGKINDYEELVFIDENCASSGTGLNWFVNGNSIALYFGEQLVLDYEVVVLNSQRFTVRTIVDIDQNGTEEEVEISAYPYDPFGWFE